MLMIHLGPLVSQALPMDHPMPGMDAGEMAGMADMSCAEAHASASTAHPADQAAAFSADHFMEKCGYCGLLIHSPPLDPPALTLFSAIPGTAPPPAVSAAQRIPTSPVFPGARSRAPPVILV
ncbi:MAG: hypothetical protein GAK45_01248 [Pseudomonas citronellolis]|nr:MAG: hypothetical protein GAK45_01248 [Pseudomonas citronellolis]